MTLRLVRALLLVSSLCTAACGSGSSSSSPAAPPLSAGLALQPVANGLASPVFMTSPPGDSSRLFIVEQAGRIRVFDVAAGALRATAFLELAGLIVSGGEQGLLGMAFDPDYASNGRFYVFYTNTNGDLVIARYLRHATDANLADPASALVLQTVQHPVHANHNGGMLAFGPDGCLYAGIGDGGSGGDPNNNAQNPASKLGKLLRISPDTGAACANGIANPYAGGGVAPEVWSLGLRNPWRFSFDRQTGDLYIGDVGQGGREEVDVATGSNPGRAVNYGWRLMEGFLCFNPSSNCNPGNLTLPVLDYAHTDGACSITGGYVYRGSAIAGLQGTYFYADFCAGFVRSFRLDNGQPIDQREWPRLSPPRGLISSFGEDSAGELYLMSLDGGLWRIVPD